MTMLSRRTLLAAALPALAAGAARAQEPEEYPTHPVTFVVPFARGGGTDTLARLLGQKLQEQLGQPFVVQNRPGEGTVIATNFVAKSPADGYTIMMAVSTLAIDVTLYKKLPYDPAKDLALVALIASVPFVLVVNPSLPVYSVDDLINLAKQRPLSFGSGGIGAFHHLAGALFASMTGIKLTHVPYRGTAPALNDLVGGYVQLMFTDLGPACAADHRRKAAPACGDDEDAPCRAAQRSAARRGRRARLRHRGVARRDRAGGDAERDRRQAQRASSTPLSATPDVRATLNDLGMKPIGKGNRRKSSLVLAGGNRALG